MATEKVKAPRCMRKGGVSIFSPSSVHRIVVPFRARFIEQPYAVPPSGLQRKVNRRIDVRLQCSLICGIGKSCRVTTVLQHLIRRNSGLPPLDSLPCNGSKLTYPREVEARRANSRPCHRLENACRLPAHSQPASATRDRSVLRT